MSQSPNRDYETVTAPEGFRTVIPLPTSAELADFYANVYFQQLPTTAYQHSYSDDEFAQRRLRADLLMHVACGLLPRPMQPDRRLIDIGFGEGFELAAGAAAGFDAFGIDYTSDALTRFHPHLASRVRLGDPESLLYDLARDGETFSVCVLRNVVEHVREPRKLMEAVKAILAPDGVVVVTVPNDFTPIQEAVLARGLSTREYWFSPPQHLQYFNTDNFQQFGISCGFEVADMVGDFPIEFFLFHPGSNYALDPSRGRAAHEARIILDLLVARRGMATFVDLCRAYARCGVCRAFSAFLRATGA